MIASNLGKLIFVGAIWGITNAFLGQATKQDENRKSSSSKADNNWHGGPCKWLAKLCNDLLCLLLNWRFLLPFLINQIGSLLFVVLLGSGDMSVAVPVCNATSLAFTALTARFLGEQTKGDSKELFAGLGLVVAGIALMNM